MSGTTHDYAVRVVWTGNRGDGTAHYRGYDRAHEISAPGKPVVAGSSDPAFRGDRSRYNPEELLVASLSACHMLWFLHLAAEAGIVVESYADDASGRMEERPDGGGHFVEVVLRPVVTARAGAAPARARALHERAHDLCFIASSVRFPVRCEPELRVAERRETAGEAARGA
jgi:organic hydroperoxide reductase OsmC/OhrA